MVSYRTHKTVGWHGMQSRCVWQRISPSKHTLHQASSRSSQHVPMFAAPTLALIPFAVDFAYCPERDAWVFDLAADRDNRRLDYSIPCRCLGCLDLGCSSSFDVDLQNEISATTLEGDVRAIGGRTRLVLTFSTAVCSFPHFLAWLLFVRHGACNICCGGAHAKGRALGSKFHYASIDTAKPVQNL